ncbi:UNVERIFIED_CONTAM: hypothetical protein K2H54_077072 [Gekko kuhli]
MCIGPCVYAVLFNKAFIGPLCSSQLQVVLLPIVIILLLPTIAGLWYCYRKRSRSRRQRDIIVMEEIPVAERSEERGPMLSAGGDADNKGPAHEETPIQPSDSSASTG